MKNKKIISVIFISSLLFGCFLHRQYYDEVRKVPKLKYETPPGTVWLRDNVFMDKCEISNLMYLEFLFQLNKHDTTRYHKMLPDTSIWQNPPIDNDLYTLFYLRYPGYRDYPVVGISYNQADEFCKWRSKMVNRYIFIRDHKMPKKYDWDTLDHIPEIVKYRLPTKEEWEYASAAGLDYFYFRLGYEKVLDKNNIPVSNTLEYYNLMKNSHPPVKMRVIEECFGPQEEMVTLFTDFTTSVKFGQPNKYGIYNLLGNVSEIIADTLFKGLNYETSLDGSTCKLQKENYQIVDSTSNGYDYKYTFRYQKPQAWLGFRCVCEVLKQKQ